MQIYSILCKCTTDLSLVKVSWQVPAFELERRKMKGVCVMQWRFPQRTNICGYLQQRLRGRTLLTFLEEVS